MDLDYTDINLLPDRYREIASKMGIDSLLKFSNLCGGTMVYIPKYETLYRQVRNGQIKNKYKKIVSEIGIDSLLKFSKLCGGSMVHIPKYETLYQEIRNKQILKEFNGYNYCELTQKFNLCIAQVRGILKEELSKTKKHYICERNDINE